MTTDDQSCINAKGPASTLSDFQQICLHAAECWAQGDTRNAWRALNIATGLIEATVSAHQPHTMEILDQLMNYWLSKASAPGIALTLLEQFSTMSATILGPAHPFTEICAYLAGMEMTQLIQALNIAWQSQIDCFTQRLGQFNSCTLELQEAALYWDAKEATSPTRSTMVQTISKTLYACERALGPSHARSIYLRSALSWMLLRQDKPHEAAEVATSTLALIDRNNKTFGDFLEVLALAQHALSEVELAEQTLRRAIGDLVDVFGWEDENVLRKLKTLWSWLKESNRPDEAAEVRRQYDELIEARYSRLNKMEEERYQRLFASSARIGVDIV